MGEIWNKAEAADPSPEAVTTVAGGELSVPTEELLGGKRKQKKPRKGALTNNWVGCIYAGIPLLGFALFSLTPAIISLVVSLGDMTGFNLSTFEFVGFKHYAEVFTDSLFWHGLGISFYITLAQLLSLLIAIIIATVLNRNVKGSKFFTVLYFIPYICSSVATVFMWQRMFNPDYGVINTLFHLDVNWFTNGALFVPMLIVIISWSAAGYGIVVLGAALVAIDQTLYEAAEIDGASGMRQFFSITLPQISPTIYFLLMLGIVNGLQTFDIAMIFVGDAWSGYGPDNMGLTLMLYIYKSSALNMPSSCVMSWMLFLVILGANKLNDFLAKRWVNND